MKPRDIALAVGVAALWGVNFVVIRVGLDHFPPLMFNALRFTFAAFPAVLFVGRPRVPWRWVLAVALALGVAKFSLLFAGMAAGMPAGLSSLVLQSQAIFTVVLAVALLRERPGRRRVIGLALAAVGVAVVAAGLGNDLPGGAFALVIAAAAAWGLSNVATRKAGATDMLRFMVWVSALAAPWLIALSLLVDGPTANLDALRTVTPSAIFAVLFVAGAATLAGFAAWGHLITRHGASTIAPFAMLVPLFGIASAALLLDEPIRPTDVLGGLLVIGGVLAGLVSVPSPRAPAAAGHLDQQGSLRP
ncbi:EamA family transporter [Asanoa iriomotensis]|uniref:Membrane protein n=1 Tax=Asanoa iriomotensis TaxID=234613 RepID=A0ABQ4CAR9_9ACTN|nr:EamA family transporter [Asanoa iriomotensis]GIF59410.1 membrane protein [Asanoa iriomotensis]